MSNCCGCKDKLRDLELKLDAYIGLMTDDGK